MALLSNRYFCWGSVFIILIHLPPWPAWHGLKGFWKSSSTILRGCPSSPEVGASFLVTRVQFLSLLVTAFICWRPTWKEAFSGVGTGVIQVTYSEVFLWCLWKERGKSGPIAHISCTLSSFLSVKAGRLSLGDHAVVRISDSSLYHPRGKNVPCSDKVFLLWGNPAGLFSWRCNPVGDNGMVTEDLP